jgi:hypothetical protein
MSGLQVKYKKLFSVSVEQDFYQNGVCRKYTDVPFPDMALLPTEECETLMRKLDIIYRSNDQAAGGIVLARVSGTTMGGNDLLRFKAAGEDKLSFYSILRNGDVLSFNELPVNADPGRIYYFSNEQTDAVAPRNDLHLTTVAAGVDGVADAVKKSGSNYRYHHSTTVATGTAFVKHVISGIQTEAKSIINQGGQSDLLFDLSSLPSGKCELLISAAVKDSFYYLKDITSRLVFAVIEVLLSQTLIGNYRVVETDQSLTPVRPAYTIKFLKRKTVWRYTIHLSENCPLARKMAAMNPVQKAAYLSNLKIETNDTTISFLQDSASDTAIVFLSVNTLALQEKYISSTSVTHEPLIITLKENTGLVNEAVIKTNLPYPSAGSIDARQLPKIYSDILITL